MQFKKVVSLICFSVLFASSSAFAEIQASLRGALDIPTSNFSFVKSPAAQVGADLTYGLTNLFQLGLTYQHDSLSYTGGGSGSGVFYGGVGRVGFFSGAFVDVQGGLWDRDSGGTSFSYGAGLGYRMPFTPLLELSPRFGYRSLPDSSITRSMVDFGVLLTLRLL